MKQTSIKKAAIEKQMAKLEKELKSIERSPAFRKEMAVIRALNGLMKKHNYSKRDLIALLQEDNSSDTKKGRNKAAKAERKTRILKIYKNPHTGETVETRGGNHKVLKAWKSEYMISNIEEWLVDTKD